MPGLERDDNTWRVSRAILDLLESEWDKPDEGIWEVRGPKRHFTHSKVMAWVAFDRAVKAVEEFGMDGPVDRWRKLRDAIHDEVCRSGFNAGINSFVQFYGSDQLDASLLMIPLVGFLDAKDPRMVGTVQAKWRLKYLGRVIEDCVLLTDVWVFDEGRWRALRRHSTPAPCPESTTTRRK